MAATEEKYVILAVDDTPENLDVLKGILIPEFKVKAAINGTMALKIAVSQPPSLILLDIMMPEMDGYEVCRALKANPTTAGIPVIFITAMSEIHDESKGFEAGGVDYITKPVQPSIVMARVRTHLALANQRRACEEMVRQRTRELDASQRAAIFMLGDAGHYNDTDTGVHIWRMAAYARILARAAQWSVADAEQLELAAAMHDSGKIGIPDSVLKAPRKLTPEEFDLVKTHATIGARILERNESPLFILAAEVALNHHERWDGTGYPNGLAGEGIPESARIVAIADVFDALTMKRPYKEPWPVERALALLQKDAGSHFDPRLVGLFMTLKNEILQIKERFDAQES
ncbi:MAG: response regulator [Magnetococcales bacterium]|nr:response regulator [Magnetococcales bacterium]